LNFPFRDPLAPEMGPQASSVIDAAALDSAATVLTRPFEVVPGCGVLDLVALERLSSHSKGLIVVGTEAPHCGDEAFADAVAMIAEKLGWPVLADVLNPLRNHAGENPSLITRYDAFLRDSRQAEAFQPTAVLQIGSLPTSKVLRAWLASRDAVSFLLSSRPINADPLHRIATPLYGDAHELAGHLQHQRIEPEWAAAWTAVEKQTVARLDARMQATDTLFEGKVAWLLSKLLPVGTPVFLASSMSVRYAEYFWSGGSRAYSIFCNRGANGIDGTLSTALGVAHGGRPTVLLVGDLAFLHDSNGLLAANQLKGSLTVVLVNNQGGGIFEHLPVAQMGSVFEGYFATPQKVEIGQLCQAYGVGHTEMTNWDQLEEALTLLPRTGVRVLEIRTDRKADRAVLSDMLPR
jgi:2-succinyl-5-enolpyruvyl-6-hydroxy-3-cyclohexene-1-carboxylate synthase